MAVKRYNGTAWVTSAGSQGITYSATAPSTPAIGDVWVSTADINTFDSLVQTGNRNVLINGDFKVWQRGTSITYSSGQPYTADRWCTTPSGTAAYSVSRQTASLTGFQYCGRLQRTAANTNTSILYLSQPVESVSSIPFAGTTIALSFYARAGANYSSASSLLGVRLVTGTGTDGNYLVASLNGQATPIDTTATLTTTWQRFTYTVAIPSGVNQLQPTFFYTPVGTAGAADYFEVTGVQLEAGTAATPFEQRPIGTELALCQRYFWRHAPTGITYLSFVYAGSQYRITLPNPVEMRVVPTSVTSSGWAGGTTPSSSVANKHAVNFVSTAGNYYIDGSTIIDISAEL
jgi:hypothetical protein